MDPARLLALQEVDSAIDRLRHRTEVLEAGSELGAARAEAGASFACRSTRWLATS
jgi:hypothetical protein